MVLGKLQVSWGESGRQYRRALPISSRDITKDMDKLLCRCLWELWMDILKRPWCASIGCWAHNLDLTPNVQACIQQHSQVKLQLEPLKPDFHVQFLQLQGSPNQNNLCLSITELEEFMRIHWWMVLMHLVILTSWDNSHCWTALKEK